MCDYFLNNKRVFIMWIIFYSFLSYSNYKILCEFLRLSLGVDINTTFIFTINIIPAVVGLIIFFEIIIFFIKNKMVSFKHCDIYKLALAVLSIKYIFIYFIKNKWIVWQSIFNILDISIISVFIICYGFYSYKYDPYYIKRQKEFNEKKYSYLFIFYGIITLISPIYYIFLILNSIYVSAELITKLENKLH